eukprot:TRINITY_DN4510_c0_g1_i3.p1 TRINITY_DN4510_c0_g1~~TRINITY_DN4510_c0_g1_i3.p1  ORF type:complete len:243 (-),score=40.87 TRINITY_DN4510_c0_g1_i3:110-838(-)
MKVYQALLLLTVVGLSHQMLSPFFSNIAPGASTGASISRSVAVATPDNLQVSTYGIIGGTATATASGAPGKITCESPVGPPGAAVVCSGELPKNVTGAVILYSKVKGSSWCLKALEDNNIVLGECSGDKYLWYFDEAYGLRIVYSTSCAAVALDETTSYFIGNVYLEEEICEEQPTRWFFDGYKIKNEANPDLCLTACVAPEDGCNTIPGIDTNVAYGVAVTECQESNAQLWVPENVQVTAA